MSACRVPFTSASTSSFENCSASARPARPFENSPDSASAPDSCSPRARTLSVVPARMRAVSATVVFEVTSAFEMASDSATCVLFEPPTAPISRAVAVLIDAVALASDVRLTAPRPRMTTSSPTVILAVLVACATPTLNSLLTTLPLASAPAVA